MEGALDLGELFSEVGWQMCAVLSVDGLVTATVLDPALSSGASIA
jgi:hypothetical protein